MELYILIFLIIQISLGDKLKVIEDLNIDLSNLNPSQRRVLDAASNGDPEALNNIGAALLSRSVFGNAKPIEAVKVT